MPHYDRCANSDAEQNTLADENVNIGDEAAIEDAAAALRGVEMEAVKEEPASVEGARLDSMSIDELRELARELAIPDRATITDQDELVAEIRKRL